MRLVWITDKDPTIEVANLTIALGRRWYGVRKIIDTTTATPMGDYRIRGRWVGPVAIVSSRRL